MKLHALQKIGSGLAAVLLLAGCATEPDALKLRTMGSLFFGGTVTHLANGETFHGDHGYAQFFIPQNARTYPLILWHGIGQSGRSFESTPDGREGFMALLPRRDWAVYIIDQPRRGRAGRTLAQKSNMRSRQPCAKVPHGMPSATESGIPRKLHIAIPSLNSRTIRLP